MKAFGTTLIAVFCGFVFSLPGASINFQTAVSLPSAGHSRFVAFGDLDADSIPEILSVGDNGIFSAIKRSGTGFTVLTNMQFPGSLYSVQYVDRSEILVLAHDEERLYHLTVDSNMHFRVYSYFQTGIGPIALTVASDASSLQILNSDNTIDSFTNGAANGQLPEYTKATNCVTGNAPSHMIRPAGNLLYVNSADNTLSLRRPNPRGAFGPPDNHVTGAFPIFVAAGDFNQDGIMDYVTANYSGASVSVFLGSAGSDLFLFKEYDVGSHPSSIAVADFDGDGHLDLAVVSATDNSVLLMLGSGHGTFSSSVSMPVGPNSIWIGAANQRLPYCQSHLCYRICRLIPGSRLSQSCLPIGLAPGHSQLGKQVHRFAETRVLLHPGEGLFGRPLGCIGHQGHVRAIRDKLNDFFPSP